MTATVEKIAKECESLSLTEASELQDALSFQIHRGAETSELDARWSKELRRRVERIKSGEAAGRSSIEVFAEAKSLCS